MNLSKIASMYITFLPIIVTGMVNAAYCKSPILNVLKVPMDGGKVLKDGKRLFGDHKTWKGFIGTGIWSMIFFVIFGYFYSFSPALMNHDFIYANYDNTIAYNALIGLIIGFVYALLELPNSFIKRRLDIKSGKQGLGISGVIFLIYDQIDSMLGVILVIAAVYPMTVLFYILFIAIAGISHVALNCILFGLKLRKNIL